MNNEALLNATNRSNSLTNGTISSHEQSAECLPSWILNAIGVKSVYASDIAVTVVHIPFAIFAFLANLAVIATIIRTSSLHVPVNVLLCGLATADCLTGLVAQPVYASWRFLLHHLEDPCRLVHLHQASKSLPFLFVGCTFLNLAITSVDRFYAVSKPLAYKAAVTIRGMFSKRLAHRSPAREVWVLALAGRDRYVVLWGKKLSSDSFLLHPS